MLPITEAFTAAAGYAQAHLQRFAYAGPSIWNSFPIQPSRTHSNPTCPQSSSQERPQDSLPLLPGGALTLPESWEWTDSRGQRGPPALTGMIEKDGLLALAPIGGHGELHPQRLARRRGVVDGGIDHLVDGVQQAGDVLDGKGSRDPRAFKTKESEGLRNLKGRNLPGSPKAQPQANTRMSGVHRKGKQE